MLRRTKGQHFLLTAAARSLSLAKALGMTEPAAEAMFAAIRWAETKAGRIARGAAARLLRLPPSERRPRWRCTACGADFSLTSGTLFAFRKLPIRVYLAAIVIFVNEVKGKSRSALALVHTRAVELLRRIERPLRDWLIPLPVPASSHYPDFL